MKQSEEHVDVVVIGGGPSGLMAAGRAAALGKRVILLEKNAQPGKKLLITGGGRSNITNQKPSRRAFLERFEDKAPFLHSAFAQHDTKDSLDFFHQRGMETKLEAEGRIFPKTERSETVLTTLLAYAKEGKVEIRNNTSARELTVTDGHIVGVRTDEGTITCDAVILSTGGLSHPETGSTGDGFQFLRTLGHTIETTKAALAPVRTKETWAHKLSGIAFPDAKVILLLDGKKVDAQKGKILFTHFGLSGPLILNMSRIIGERIQEGYVTLMIDLFPALDQGALDRMIRDVFDSGRNKRLRNALAALIPSALAHLVPELLPDIGDKPVHEVSRNERILIAHFLKRITLTPTGLLGPEHSIVTSGGVPLSEIDMRTMRSKRVPNLFITGDLLDINRPSGGYSLQLCWTTGWVAGSHAGADH